MHLQANRVTQNGKVYEYVRLVTSYRRESDGMPMKKVVANLGALSEEEVHNLRVALDASRKGKRVAVTSVRQARPAKPEANLDYLDIAVLLAVWRHQGLDGLLRGLLPSGHSTVSPADVAAALIIHRCVDPGSKLEATRWFPRTALPELLDIDADEFGNSRLHRDLEKLASQTPAIMRGLPCLYLGDRGADSFSTLYVDISDATFTGKGPSLAKPGRAKDDTIRRKIGIVLVCDERGYPVRWKVLAGNAAEAPVMIKQMALASKTTWGKQVPFIADRAVGRTAYVRQLLDAGVYMVTAMVRPEIRAYVPNFDELVMDDADYGADGWRKRLEAQLKDRSFLRVDDSLFVRDLGIVIRNDRDEDEDGRVAPAHEDDPNDIGRHALSLVRTVLEMVQSGAASSQNQAARQLGHETTKLKWYFRLRHLVPDIQEQVLAGDATGIALERLLRVGKLPSQEQPAAFAELIALREAGRLPRLANHRAPKSNSDDETAEPPTVRAVLYFNPEMYEHQQHKAQERLEEVNAFVDKLNAAARDKPKSADKLFAAVDRKLRKREMLKVFEVSTVAVKIDGKDVHQVRLHLRKGEWKRRRELDGLSLLVAHPKIAASAEELCRLYRAKDAVEKDFQTIKSVVRMLPVRHRTDGKVVAHVTLCVLALTLERMLRNALSGTMTAERALETLATCRLNRYGDEPQDRAYLVTKPDQAQSNILRTLELQHLTDDDQMMEAIHPK